MITLAGTEPSTIAGRSKVLGGASTEASTLRSEMVQRMTIMSDPGAVLVGNPELLRSQRATQQIANTMIADTTSAIPAAVDEEATAQRNTAIRDAALVLAAILLALLIVTLVARSLVRPLRTLRDSALKVAHDDLAQEIERVRAGGEPGPVDPIPVHTTEEVGQVAHAVDELHEQAVFLAGEHARLQLQVGDMFETLSRRSRSLVDQQLSLIDRLERDEEDPDRLDSLFPASATPGSSRSRRSSGPPRHRPTRRPSLRPVCRRPATACSRSPNLSSKSHRRPSSPLRGSATT